ncbi:MAG TPA: hypothetical protein VKW78_01130 [Terriglobales bacterium]|nr:hypothetical protein [Terriglobales bacterium]
MAGKRMIHDRVCESRKVNSVDFYAEVLWVRLLTKADDNGNYYRSVKKIHANCMEDKAGASEERTEKAIRSLIEVGLLGEYEADDRKFVHVTDFHEWQELRGDKGARIDHPLHPVEMGGAYVGEGLRRDTWVSQSDRGIVTPGEPAGNRSVPRREPAGNRSVPRREQEGSLEVEVEVEAKLAKLTSGDLKTLKTIFREQTGAKAKVSRTGKTAERLSELLERYGLSPVLEAIPQWVADEGGKEAVQNDRRKREWAFANFIRDAQEIIEAQKCGVFADGDSDEILRVSSKSSADVISELKSRGLMR